MSRAASRTPLLFKRVRSFLRQANLKESRFLSNYPNSLVTPPRSIVYTIVDRSQSIPLYTQALIGVCRIMHEQHNEGEPTPPQPPHSVESELLALVYEELRLLAGSYLRADPHHTLQPTALVHEAYMKLHKGNAACSEKAHFVATASIAMRQVLVDHARAKNALKRGGSAARADISMDLLPAKPGSMSAREIRVLELDELLTKLATVDPRAAHVAQLRLFGGMEQSHIAEVLGVSRTTVVNDWSFAKAWLTSHTREDRH